MGSPSFCKYFCRSASFRDVSALLSNLRSADFCLLVVRALLLLVVFGTCCSDMTVHLLFDLRITVVRGTVEQAQSLGAS